VSALPDLIDTLMREAAHARFTAAEQRFTHRLPHGRMVSVRRHPRRATRARIRIGVRVRLTVTAGDCTTVLGIVMQALAGGSGGYWLDSGLGFYLTCRSRCFGAAHAFDLCVASRRWVVRRTELTALAAVLIRFNQQACGYAADPTGPVEVPR
jgi:hypothetical protein